MKLSEIEYTQRIKELKCLLDFYKIQIEPFKGKAGPQHDEYLMSVAYLDIIFQLEKLLLYLDYNGQLKVILFTMPFSLDSFFTQRFSKLVLLPCSNATLAIEHGGDGIFEQALV
ncbi:hypothetical protein [Acinetobacter sp. AS167]|uniref:hypothetical protein n=1 Tax=Acinetobacter sp. AS167 TaxID=3127884 RepID=UPI00301984AD